MLVESFSGIRGIFKEDMSRELIVQYAGAFARFLKKKTNEPVVVLGMDTRPSSTEIKEMMKSVFVAEGINVIDVGFNPTPAVQLGVREFKATGGVMITASHNEPDWNGWKLLSEKGSLLSPEDIALVIRKSKTAYEPGQGQGTVVDKGEELRKKYIGFVLELIGQDGVEAMKQAEFEYEYEYEGISAVWESV